MNKMCGVHKAAWWLMWIGALNWGLIGLLGINLVMTVFGPWPVVERVVYILVGVAAVFSVFSGKCCLKGGMCACHDEKCGHCGPQEKKEMPSGGMGGEKKM